MNFEEFQEIRKKAPEAAPRFHVQYLLDQTPRTLLYGYMCDRSTWHVYLEDGKIHALAYDTQNLLSYDAATVWPMEGLLPDKRVYPESTDAALAWILKEHDMDVPYTAFDQKRYETVKDMPFHGKRAGEVFP